MRNKKVLFWVCILIPITVGSIASVITKDSMSSFLLMKQPPFSPPAWIFPTVWTVLYLLMGIASYLVMQAKVDKKQKEKAILLYEYQLLVNFLWPTFFFHFEWYLFSFLWLILIWVLVVLMIVSFWKIDKRAAVLNIPYLIWLTFAGYLNLAIWWLN